MAAPLYWNSSPESSRPPSRVRWHGHTRPESQQPPRCRRAHSDDRRRTSRCSPPRQPQPHSFSPQPHQNAQSQAHWITPNPTPPPPPSLELPSGITMERTPSGHSILSEPSKSSTTNTNTLNSREPDIDAAQRVERHFRRLQKSKPHKHERILRKLIYSPTSDPLDDLALDGILTAANTVFFDGVLSGRVSLDWSSAERYRTEVIGTTALRPKRGGDGFETLIVLSEPIFRNPYFEVDRRLLLSAFLHELIHCYLFIECGFEARVEGGHTEGFHKIAELVDGWVGRGYLCLCKEGEDPRRWTVERDSSSSVSSFAGSGEYEAEHTRLKGTSDFYDNMLGDKYAHTNIAPPHFQHEHQPLVPAPPARNQQQDYKYISISERHQSQYQNQCPIPPPPPPPPPPSSIYGFPGEYGGESRHTYVLRSGQPLSSSHLEGIQMGGVPVSVGGDYTMSGGSFY